MRAGPQIRPSRISVPVTLLLAGGLSAAGKKSGHGDQSLKEAVQNSCNVYFWKIGLDLGADGIAEYADKFGLGEKTGVDIPGEVKGELPSRAWKMRRLKERWYKGETLNYSIGQGYLLCTPLQVGRVMSAFANGGYLVRPFLVEEVEGVKVNDGKKEAVGVSQDSINIVREGLRRVVNDPQGTGMKARLENVVVAGKTGTAQTSRGKDHGWFAGFAPFDEPKMAIVVFDEYGGKGGYFAAGTAGKVLKRAEELGLL